MIRFLPPLRGDSGKSFSAASQVVTPQRLASLACGWTPGSLAEKLSPLVPTTLRSIGEPHPIHLR